VSRILIIFATYNATMTEAAHPVSTPGAGPPKHPPNPPERIVHNYTDDQAGQAIREEDTIRARNGKWYTQEEIDHFPKRSSPRCPTYGNCFSCFSSGPVARRCPCCKDVTDDWTFYQVVFVGTTSGVKCIMDAEFLARFFLDQEGRHEGALADRMYNWLQTPRRGFLGATQCIWALLET
jgi:hypothetical protein